MVYLAVFNSPFYGGGLEQVVAQTVSRYDLIKKSEITLLCNDPKQPSTFQFEGIHCLNLITSRSSFWDKVFLRAQLAYSKKIAQFASAHLKKGDLLHIHGLEYAFHLPRKSVRQYSLIATCHGSLFVQNSDYAKRLPGKFFFAKLFFAIWRFYYLYIEKTAVSRIDGVTYITRTIKDFYEQFCRVKLPGAVIYNGFNQEEKIPTRKKTDRHFSALIVGSNSFIKGLDLALKMVELVNAQDQVLTLTIVGFADFVKTFPEWRNKSFINYIGRVAPDKIVSFYKQCDFLLLPSRSEGFPLTILEGLSYGLPFIDSTACHSYEIESYKKLGIVIEEYSISTWVKMINQMINLENYQRFCQAINKADLSQYYWENIAKEYEKFYQFFIRTAQ